MRRILLVLSVIFLSVHAQAQVVIGRSYKPGCYYDNSGKKIIGLIDFEPSRDRIHFKANKNSSSEKISIKDISAVVMSREDVNGAQAPDSVTVLTENNQAGKKYFAQLCLATPVTKFYYKFLVDNIGGPITTPTTVNEVTHETILTTTDRPTRGDDQLIMYQEGNTTYQLTKGNYIDVLSKALANVPDLVKRIQSKEFKFRNVYQIFQQYRSQTNYKGN